MASVNMHGSAAAKSTEISLYLGFIKMAKFANLPNSVHHLVRILVRYIFYYSIHVWFENWVVSISVSAKKKFQKISNFV